MIRSLGFWFYKKDCCFKYTLIGQVLIKKLFFVYYKKKIKTVDLRQRLRVNFILSSPIM
jgi:hypothetical protein